MRCLLMRCFFAFVSLLVAVSIGAFLLYVTLWPVLAVSLAFLGMVLTFLLGALLGSGRVYHCTSSSSPTNRLMQVQQ